MSDKPLISFGYWRSSLEPDLPDPAWFVDDEWAATAEQQCVVAYLKQGHPFTYWMGYSWCRFQCGISDAHMGFSDLTDGTYCWPSGLAHYLVQHRVRLPNSVVQHIAAQAFFPKEMAALIKEYHLMDDSWWKTQRSLKS